VKGITVNILYFDCYAGISGDMTVGAFLDLGVPLAALDEALALLPIPRDTWTLAATPVTRRGITGTKFTATIRQEQHHRHYGDIAAMIDTSALPAQVRATAGRIFHRLATAEAKVHGVQLDHVHFHEVGALDSIIDIVATAVCFHHLGIETAHATALPLGGGFVQTAHGTLPVPTPATAELLRGLPVHSDLGQGERVTPTGAAIIATLCSGFGAPPPFTVTAIGNGAGDRDYPDAPNILRLFHGDRPTSLAVDEIRVLETHIDDMNPEILGFLMDRLLAAGALDVTFSPLQMKKNRPGVRLTVLATPAGHEALARMVLTESSAIGIRAHSATRLKLAREEALRQTSLGPVQVKVLRDGAALVRTVPEFEECRRIAEEKNMPLLDVYRIIEKEI
jgi:pyridinium-3,5-bisthiocarboxylic acid mononucleotide nickel chelatase